MSKFIKDSNEVWEIKVQKKWHVEEKIAKYEGENKL
jgi:hypothetical protein